MSSKPSRIRFTSIQAENQHHVGRLISEYVSLKLSHQVEYVDGLSWQDRERLLDTGYFQAGWICGLPYIQKADQINPTVELLAAPVMSGARYQDRPIYFSDVIVHHKSPFMTFSDLRGASWAYNDPNSHSGYNITRYHLASTGQTGDYFGKVVEAGAHQDSLEMVLNGEIDASAIDSTVLEIELHERPKITNQLRVIEVFGPSPTPPWVVSSITAPSLRKAIRHVFLEMHREPAGKVILDRVMMARFAPVSDGDYDPIRNMARLASQITWS